MGDYYVLKYQPSGPGGIHSPPATALKGLKAQEDINDPQSSSLQYQVMHSKHVEIDIFLGPKTESDPWTLRAAFYLNQSQTLDLTHVTT